MLLLDAVAKVELMDIPQMERVSRCGHKKPLPLFEIGGCAPYGYLSLSPQEVFGSEFAIVHHLI